MLLFQRSQKNVLLELLIGIVNSVKSVENKVCQVFALNFQQKDKKNLMQIMLHLIKLLADKIH